MGDLSTVGEQQPVGEAVKRALILLVAFLAACGDVGLRGVEPRVYTEPLVYSNDTISATFMLAANADATTQWCTARGIRAPAAGRVTTGCTIRPRSPYNSTDNWIIIAVRPTSWNDHPSLSNLGHEVSHALGGTHE